MKRTLYLTLALGMFVTGCTEDFLKPQPLSFYSLENTLIDKDGMEGLLASCLNSMRTEFYGDGAPLITEGIFSDIAVEGTTDKTGPAQDLPAQILPDADLNNVNTNRIGYYWTEAFNRIKYANIVISRIDDVKWASEAERNNVLGKAYFFRAATYYRLCHQFGDVPLIIEEISSPRMDFYSCTRTSILRKCKKDLKFAVQWVKSEAEGARVGDINKAAVLHVLTKVNLALLAFDDAVASASAVINDPYYHLMTERFGVDKNDPNHDVIWDLHQPLNKALPENRERIMLFVSRLDYTEGGASAYSSIMRQAVPFYSLGSNIKTPTGQTGLSDLPLGSRVGNLNIEIDIVTKYGRGLGRLRPTPYYQFDVWDDPNDKRHSYPNWITMEDLVYNHPNLKAINDPYYGKPLQKYDDNGGLLCTDTIRSWFNWPHYKLYIPDPTTAQPAGGYGDWYGFRLAETYLLRAEAYFWKGDLDRAAQDVNAVRTRAGCDEYTASDINIGTILDERARELYYEEPRKTEITRISFILAESGKPAYNGKVYTMDQFANSNFWYDRIMEKNVFYRENVPAPNYTYRAAPWIALWPIPAAAINANSLGVINQNTGYPGAERNVRPAVWVDGEGEGTIQQQ